MYIDVQHKTWHHILSDVTFALLCHRARDNAAHSISPLRSRSSDHAYAMLPYHDADWLTPDAEEFAEHAEETRQLAQLHISQQQLAGAQCYNIRHRKVFYNPGDLVSVCTPFVAVGSVKSY